MALQTSKDVLRTRTAWTLQCILALVFLFTAYRKFTGHPVPVETIDALGADQWVRITIGILELFGGGGLVGAAPCASGGRRVVASHARGHLHAPVPDWGKSRRGNYSVPRFLGRLHSQIQPEGQSIAC